MALRFILVISSLLLISFEGFAFQAVPFETIQEFHDTRLNSILSNYGLEDRLEISVLISPTKMKTLNRRRRRYKIRIPGILLGGIQEPEDPLTPGLFEIMDSLKHYKRDVTVVKNRRVSKKEMKTVLTAIREYLDLRPEESLQVVDNVFKFDKAMLNWREDLKEAFYQSTFRSSYWTWIPVCLFAFILISILIARSLSSGLRSLGSSIEKIEGAGGSRSDYGNFRDLNEMVDDSKTKNSESEEIPSQKNIDLPRLYNRIKNVYEKSKPELSRVLWTSIPTTGERLSFYDLIINEIESQEEEHFREMYFDIFRISADMFALNQDAKAVSQKTLIKLNKALSFADMMETNIARDRALKAILPEYGNSIREVIKSSVERFFNVVFYLFPDLVVEVIQEDPVLSGKIAKKISSYMLLSDKKRQPSAEQLNDFIDHVREFDESLNSGEDQPLDPQVLSLLQNVPDNDLFDSNVWSTQQLKVIKKSIPPVTVINGDDPFRLKKFFLALSNEEMAYISQQHPDFSLLREIVDQRGRIRVDEKVQRGLTHISSVNLAALRQKIIKIFDYDSTLDEHQYENDLFKNVA